MTGETTCWFAGVDWGSERHQACLLEAAGKVVGERAFAHGCAGRAAPGGWQASTARHSSTMAVAINAKADEARTFVSATDKADKGARGSAGQARLAEQGLPGSACGGARHA